MKKKINILLTLIFVGTLLMPISQSSASKHKPTLAQIEAAKKAEAAKKKIAADALKRL